MMKMFFVSLYGRNCTRIANLTHKVIKCNLRSDVVHADNLSLEYNIMCQNNIIYLRTGKYNNFMHKYLLVSITLSVMTLNYTL